MPAGLQIRLQSNTSWELFCLFFFLNKVSNSSAEKVLSREQRSQLVHTLSSLSVE